MASRRIALAAVFQAVLFACGAGAAMAVRSGLAATALTLGLVALWIAAAASWQARLRPAALAGAPSSAGEGDAARLRLLAGLLDQTPAPLVTRDIGGGYQAANRAARVLFRTDGALLPPPASLVTAVERGDARGRAMAEVGEGEAARTYAVSLSDMVADAGPLRLAVLLDIEPELRAAEAGALREVMQVLSHEIMNGLTPVASLAATARDLLAAGDADARVQAGEALEVLARRAEGLARFAAGYRTLARLPPPVRRPVVLADLMDEAGRLFQSRWSAEGVALRVTPPTGDLKLAVDRDQIMHALMNLMTNAAQAALAGTGAARVELSGSAEPGGAVLRVADSGEGVPDAVLEHIGKPFFTTKPHGGGVGLSLARQIARAHGGSLGWQAHGPLGGARFDLILSG